MEGVNTSSPASIVSCGGRCLGACVPGPGVGPCAATRLPGPTTALYCHPARLALALALYCRPPGPTMALCCRPPGPGPTTALYCRPPDLGPTMALNCRPPCPGAGLTMALCFCLAWLGPTHGPEGVWPGPIQGCVLSAAEHTHRGRHTLYTVCIPCILTGIHT